MPAMPSALPQIPLDGEIMLKYPCLVLDHDDTVVQSEATVNYPFFVEWLKKYHPDAAITREEYISGCFDPGYIEMCRQWFGFSEEELADEYAQWKEYIKTKIPDPYPGIERIIRRQKEEGGILCVISQSAQSNILRDYRAHFGIEPDAIYGWDLEPEYRKPSPWSLEQIMANYHLSPAQIFIVDDMKPACQMARAAGVEIGFAGWGRQEFPQITEEMTNLCDYAFDTIEALERFLFEEDAK